MRKPLKSTKFALQRETIRNLSAVTGGLPVTSGSQPTTTVTQPTTDPSAVDACPSMMPTACTCTSL